MTANPFDWGYDFSDFFVSSEVVTISFNYAENKSEIEISGLSEDRMVQIWIPTINNSAAAELGLNVADPVNVFFIEKSKFTISTQYLGEADAGLGGTHRN